MATIAGIKFTKDAKRRNRFVTIDLKKHGDLFNPILQKVGALDSDDFEQDWKNGLSGEDFWGGVKEHIKIHFKNKK